MTNTYFLEYAKIEGANLIEAIQNNVEILVKEINNEIDKNWHNRYEDTPKVVEGSPIRVVIKRRGLTTHMNGKDTDLFLVTVFYDVTKFKFTSTNKFVFKEVRGRENYDVDQFIQKEELLAIDAELYVDKNVIIEYVNLFRIPAFGNTSFKLANNDTIIVNDRTLLEIGNTGEAVDFESSFKYKYQSVIVKDEELDLYRIDGFKLIV